jgi:transposase InsO family protein
VNNPNQVYTGDITYIPTQEGWLYLAVVIDLYSRQIVGWSMAVKANQNPLKYAGKHNYTFAPAIIFCG